MFIDVSNLTVKNNNVHNVEKMQTIDVHNVETFAKYFLLFLNAFHNIVNIIFK